MDIHNISGMSQDKNCSVASKLNDSTFAAGEENGHFEARKEIHDKLPQFVQAVKAWVSSNPMWFPDASLQAWARNEAEGEDLRTDDLELRLKQVLGVAAAEPSAGPSAVSPSQTTEDAAAVPNAAWVHIQERLPVDGEVVIAGHVAGWIERDILFADGGFRKRHNANTGGKAGYQQKDWKKPDGTPASPNDWPFGHTCFPTHWQPYPAVPNMPVPEARRIPSWEKPVLGYFRKGGTKWMLVQVDGNSLTGYDIAPGGGVHTLHIARESVDAFVLINKD